MKALKLESVIERCYDGIEDGRWIPWNPEHSVENVELKGLEFTNETLRG